MKYQITRQGTTVCIGHCKDKQPLTAQALTQTVDEICRRNRRGKFHDNGVTFTAQDFIGILPGDVITLTTEHEILTFQIYENKDFTILDRHTRPITISE